MKKTIHGEWSSRFAFILAATGSAVGLGNIWKFPYITGENGGGAFVLVYLACVVLIGIPIMMAETMLGRRTRQDPVNTMQMLAEEASADPRWQYLGWMGVAAGLLILSYYSVIAGWSSAYVLKAFTGKFFDGDAATIKNLFDDFVGNPTQLLFWHSLFMATTLLIVVRGVHDGLEQAVRWLMPGLFLLMILLLGYAMTTDGYFQGMRFLLYPDFGKLSANSILAAMGQAFFTLSLGMGAVMVYGSYLSSEVSIGKASFIIAFADTLVALLAGLIIFPIVFTHGLHPDSGPGLIFKTLPLAFGNMTGGWLFGLLFFVVLTIAALTSSIALIEPAVAWLVESKNMKREKACILAGLTAWLLGFGTVFSFNLWSEMTFFGNTFFLLLDNITSNVLLPIGGLGIAVFSGWVMHRQHSEEELSLPNSRCYDGWKFLVCYVAPVAVFLVFLNAIGVL